MEVIIGVVRQCCGEISLLGEHLDIITNGTRYGNIRIDLGGIYSTSGSASSSVAFSAPSWRILTLALRMRGLTFFCADSFGAGVLRRAPLALVVFMPSGARFRGPNYPVRKRMVLDPDQAYQQE